MFPDKETTFAEMTEEENVNIWDKNYLQVANLISEEDYEGAEC